MLELLVKIFKMKETTLLKISLLCSILGLLALYIASSSIDVKDYRNGVTKVDEDVRLAGTIEKITKKDNVAFIKLRQDSRMDVVAFLNGDMKLGEGDKVEVTGRVQEYNGKEEIVAQKIRVTG